MSSTCVLDRDRLTLRLHPEALFDQKYHDHELDPKAYRRMRGRWHLRRARGLDFAAGKARLLAEGVGDGVMRIRCFANGSFRQSTTERLGLLSVPPATRLEPEQSTAIVSARHGCMAFQCDLQTGNWSVAGRTGTIVSIRGGGIRFAGGPGEVGAHPRFLAAFDLPQGEVFGGGGRVAPFSRRGSTMDMYAVKTGARPGDYGGFPIPILVWPNGTALFLNNPWPHVYFDVGASDPTQWWVHAPGGDCDWFVIDGGDMPGLLRRFSAIVGRMPFPKKWWLGFWTSALAFSSADEVENVGRRLRSEGYPCDALVIDGPWRGGPEFLKKYMSDGEYPTNDLNWHPDFGNGPRMLSANAKRGFHTILHQNSRSYLPSTAAKAVPAGQLRIEGRETVPTFGTETGEKFYAAQVRPRHKEGIGMWWLDHGDRVSGNLLPGIPSRNLFGSMWARATRRCFEKDGLGPTLSLIRGSCIGGQSCSLPWPGDTRFGQDAFIEDVWFALAAGVSGFSLTSADLGGFMVGRNGMPGEDNPFDTDNLARRLCQGIMVIPNPRMHQSDSHPAKLPWNCPPRIRTLYKAMLIERYRLTPYYFSWAIHASRTGEPIARPVWYQLPSDPKALACQDQLLIGDSLMAAPVFTRGAKTRDVYLPQGNWYCFWTGLKREGGRTITVKTPMFNVTGLPLFVKAGAIIPRQEATPFLRDDPPSRLTLDVCPDGTARFDCHESREITHSFACTDEAGLIALTIPNLTTRVRAYDVRLHVDRRPAGIQVNGRTIDARQWKWSPNRRVAEVKVRIRPA